jgi:hypothetical protein
MAEPLITSTSDVIIPFEISVIVLEYNNLPGIELRKRTNDKELIKKLVSCAYHEIPILVLPKFSDRLKSINSLLEKGIIYYDKEKKQYFFTF